MPFVWRCFSRTFQFRSMRIEWNHDFIVSFKGCKGARVGRMKGLSGETVVTYGNCHRFPFSFQLVFHYLLRNSIKKLSFGPESRSGRLLDTGRLCCSWVRCAVMSNWEVYSSGISENRTHESFCSSGNETSGSTITSQVYSAIKRLTCKLISSLNQDRSVLTHVYVTLYSLDER
jgi:hypothetical protein